jgi:hypothetical protein
MQPSEFGSRARVATWQEVRFSSLTIAQLRERAHPLIQAIVLSSSPTVPSMDPIAYSPSTRGADILTRA